MTFLQVAGIAAALIVAAMSAGAATGVSPQHRSTTSPSRRWVARLTLVRRGSGLFLKKGRNSLELFAAEKPEVVRLAGGATLDAGRWRDRTAKPVILRRDGSRTTIDLDAILDTWLKQDEVWGGHANANQLRYMHRGAGGMSGQLVNPVPAGPRWLAIIWWHAMGPSGEPVYFQHLVRIDETGEVNPIRPLTPPGQVLGSTQECRLFTFRSRILLYRPGEVVELTRDGVESARYAALPQDVYPARLLRGRYWLLVPTESEKARVLYALDLLDRRARRVLMPEASAAERAYASLVHADPLSGEAVVAWRSYSGGRADVYVIDVRKPAAKRSDRAYLTRLITRWHGIDVAGLDNEFDCYDARTGRLMKRLVDPAAATPSK